MHSLPNRDRKVLIAEDDEEVALFLLQAATEEGYTAQVLMEGLAACEQAKKNAFDLILLDVMLPVLDGFSICRLLRSAHVATPILILTARDAEADKIEGLDSGADDYIVKPFSVAELLARMRALLRRSAPVAAPLSVADLLLDPVAHRVRRGGVPILLSQTEYTLLECLVRNKGRVLSRSNLLQEVWEYDFNGNDNIVEVYISHLRSKIDRGRLRSLIRTVRGIGYEIAEP